MKAAFGEYYKRVCSLDSVAGWFFKAAQFSRHTPADFAFVSTNSICQGGQVPVLWPILYTLGVDICFAFSSFKWRNLASNNAVVTVMIVGLSRDPQKARRLFTVSEADVLNVASCDIIGPYLIPGTRVIVEGVTKPLSEGSVAQIC